MNTLLTMPTLDKTSLLVVRDEVGRGEVSLARASGIGPGNELKTHMYFAIFSLPAHAFG